MSSLYTAVMPNTNPLASILIIDDDQAWLDSLSVFIRESLGIRPQTAKTPDQAFDLMAMHLPEVILCDVRLPDASGMDLLKHLRNNAPSCEVIMMTAHASVQDAVAALREGAFDYLIKPFPMEELAHLLDRLIRIRTLDRENKALSRRLSLLEEVEGYVGTSSAALRLRRLLPMIAASDAPVFLGGESGTGKSHFARTLHKCGPRSSKPFITIECASIPHDLLESELFGYEKGAFTGASKRKPGRFEMANEGTLFLDEIGDLPLDLQAKLLRALQEHAFLRVGGTELVSIDVRVIAATNKPIEDMVREGSFREDLYYRLNVIPINMPALRERTEDIPTLIEHILTRICHRMQIPRRSICPKALEEALRHPWPGNIRELENVLERSMILNPGDCIESLIFDTDASHTADMTHRIMDLVLRHDFKTIPLDLFAILGTMLRMSLDSAGSPRDAAARLKLPQEIFTLLAQNVINAKLPE